jgi:phosphonate dehydrogenase
MLPVRSAEVAMGRERPRREAKGGGESVKPRVVITHRVHPEVIELLESSFEVVANQTPETLPRKEVLRRAAAARVIIVFMPDRVDEEFLRECPNLKIVAGALKGYDNLDVEACTRRGVWLTVCEDLLTVPTAELAVGLLIGIARRVPEGDRRIKSGSHAGWRPELYGKGLAGSTVGIIGMGKVGRTLARMLRSFNARILYADPCKLDAEEEQALGARRAPLDELLPQSDFVVPLVHLKEGTLHLIGVDALSKAKPGSFLINVGRGSVVDEQAVAWALRSGHLAGYAADVFEMEDWARQDRPKKIPVELLEHPRTLFTPHLGSAVEKVRLQIELEAARNALQELKGKVPEGAVNHLRRRAS